MPANFTAISTVSFAFPDSIFESEDADIPASLASERKLMFLI